MDVVFLLAAELDIFRAYRLHGASLHAKIDAALRHVQGNPEMAPLFGGRFRRKLVLRSPYAVYYAVEGGRILVHAVIDQRASPEEIRARLLRP